MQFAKTNADLPQQKIDSSSQTSNTSKTIAEPADKKSSASLFQKNSFSKNELLASTQESKHLKELSLLLEVKEKTEMESKVKNVSRVLSKHTLGTILLIYFLVGAIVVEIFYIYLTVSGAYPAEIFIFGNALIIIALIIILVRR